MKIKSLLFLLSALLALNCFCPRTAEEITRDMSALLEAAEAETSTAVAWEAESRTLQIGDIQVPISNKMRLDWTQESRCSFRVNFYFEDDSEVTSAADPEFSRAYWKISFPAGQDCAEFVQLVDELRQI